MGRKPAADEKKEVVEEPVTIDPPVVVDLKVVDDKYLAIEQELEKAITKLRREYQTKFDPVLAERKKILDVPSTAEGDEANIATPACKGFWFTALKRLPSTTDEIEDHDEPVLEYLSDVRTEDLDPLDENKGFKVEFVFVENSYFTNDVLTVEFHGKESNPYSKEMSCVEIKSTQIDWKPGKDVTVEKVAKKVKGGGAKKKKAKESEEPRDSFFRSTFRNIKLGDDIPDDINMEEMLDQIDGDEDDFLEQYLDNQLEMFRMVRDNLVPHAVRVYTGEAFPDEDDNDEEGEEESDEDDSEEDDSEEAPVAKKKGKGSPKKKAPAAGGQAKEECKQQ